MENNKNREMFYGFDGGLEMGRNMPPEPAKKTETPTEKPRSCDYEEAKDAALFRGFDGGLEMDPFARLRISDEVRAILAEHDPKLEGFYAVMEHGDIVRLKEAPGDVRGKVLEFYADRLALENATGNDCVVSDFVGELKSGLAARVKPVRELAANIEENAAKFDRYRYATGMNVD